MCRRHLLAAALLLGLVPAPVRADAFDLYINPILTKASQAKGVKELKKLTMEDILGNLGIIPNAQAALVVVQTNDGCYSKLLVQAAQKKLNDENQTLVPIVLLERYATYRAGTERTIQASGQNVVLFDGFRFSLDQGQVVPEKLGGDIRFVALEKGDKPEIYLEPVGKAKLYLLTEAMPEATPQKGGKFVMGENFEPRYFNGKFKLYDDGRRSGILELKVEKDGEVSGSYTSDRDGAKYDVTGKLGAVKHAVQFTIKFPRTEQKFQAWMFTGTGLILAGSSKLQDREAGFYATRIEDE